MAVVLSAALEVIPSRLAYTYGATSFGDLVTRPIPRALWPSKPEPPRRKLISTLWPAESQHRSVNPEFSILLYPFWDFGYVGVIAALALFGVGVRFFRETLVGFADSRFVQLFASFALWFIVITVRNGPVDVLVGAAFTIGPLFLIFRALPHHERVIPAASGRCRAETS
jgi:hypothetical protein